MQLEQEGNRLEKLLCKKAFHPKEPAYWELLEKYILCFAWGGGLESWIARRKRRVNGDCQSIIVASWIYSQIPSCWAPVQLHWLTGDNVLGSSNVWRAEAELDILLCVQDCPFWVAPRPFMSFILPLPSCSVLILCLGYTRLFLCSLASALCTLPAVLYYHIWWYCKWKSHHPSPPTPWSPRSHQGHAVTSNHLWQQEGEVHMSQPGVSRPKPWTFAPCWREGG